MLDDESLTAILSLDTVVKHQHSSYQVWWPDERDIMDIKTLKSFYKSCKFSK